MLSNESRYLLMFSSKIEDLDDRIADGSGFHPKEKNQIDSSFFKRKEDKAHALRNSRLLIAAILQKECDEKSKKPVKDEYTEEASTPKSGI